MTINIFISKYNGKYPRPKCIGCETHMNEYVKIQISRSVYTKTYKICTTCHKLLCLSDPVWRSNTQLQNIPDDDYYENTLNNFMGRKIK